MFSFASLKLCVKFVVSNWGFQNPPIKGDSVKSLLMKDNRASSKEEDLNCSPTGIPEMNKLIYDSSIFCYRFFYFLWMYNPKKLPAAKIKTPSTPLIMAISFLLFRCSSDCEEEMEFSFFKLYDGIDPFFNFSLLYFISGKSMSISVKTKHCVLHWGTWLWECNSSKSWLGIGIILFTKQISTFSLLKFKKIQHLCL